MKIILTLLLSVFSLSLFADAVKVGAPAPVVTAKSDAGETVDFAKLYKSGYTLVYFYPRADTPGCTAQACSLRDSYAALTKKGVQVVGVSTDDVAAQKAFKTKYKLPFTLVADTDEKVAKAFEVPVNGGFASRQAFLVKDGKFIWIDRQASTKEQAADVLKILDGKS